MNKTPYIIWEDDYLVGNDEMDMHHNRMFGIINDLYEMMRDSASGSNVTDLLKRTLEYAQMHFVAEETLIGSTQYPGLEEQRQAHRGYVRALTKLVNENALSENALAEDLLHFLKEWWLNHILRMDMNYVPFLRKKD
jgi:hemerythrin-like metal-binding protein